MRVMTLGRYNAFCAKLPHTTHVVQWGDAHVWKVAGKVFAIAHESEAAADDIHVTFKCSELSYDLLKDEAGCRPAPYLASRGLKWIQWMGPESVDESALLKYIAESHRLAALGLSQRTQRSLGVGAFPPSAHPTARPYAKPSIVSRRVRRGEES